MNVLLAPQISEKATYVAEKNEQVIFRVVSDATKPEIKAAVELMFKVSVENVQVAVVKGKQKRFGRFMGRRKDWKKAYVCLAPGQEINFAAERARVNIMALIKLKPTSPGRRAVVRVVNPDLHKGKPHAALLEKKNRTAGRNHNGHITVRHMGGGHKKSYRMVDFKRDKDGIPATVEHLEYDPNRTAHLALLVLRGR